MQIFYPVIAGTEGQEGQKQGRKLSFISKLSTFDVIIISPKLLIQPQGTV